jgi:hypothetical protein
VQDTEQFIDQNDEPRPANSVVRTSRSPPGPVVVTGPAEPPEPFPGSSGGVTGPVP